MAGLEGTWAISSPNATFTGEKTKARRGEGPVQVTQQVREQAEDSVTLLPPPTTHTNQSQTNEVKTQLTWALFQPFRIRNTPPGGLPWEG